MQHISQNLLGGNVIAASERLPRWNQLGVVARFRDRGQFRVVRARLISKAAQRRTEQPVGVGIVGIGREHLTRSRGRLGGIG